MTRRRKFSKKIKATKPSAAPFEILPQKLNAAVLEFQKWSQSQLLKEQNASTPTKPLYHYTTEVGLRGILETSKLWCFSHLDQKDTSEFYFSLKIARSVLKTVGSSKNRIVHHLCACIDDIVHTNENNKFSKTFGFYLFSVSRHRDDRGQWDEYANRGKGFAIGFAPRLFYPEYKELKENANENTFVGRVIYGKKKTETRHRKVITRAAIIASRIGRANRELLSNWALKYFRAITLEVIASQLIWNCLTAKHSKFSNEREVRYIIMGVHDKFRDLLKFRKKDNKRASYIETPVPLHEAGSIAEIIVGPNASDKSEETVRSILNSLGYDQNIPIRRSKLA